MKRVILVALLLLALVFATMSFACGGESGDQTNGQTNGAANGDETNGGTNGDDQVNGNGDETNGNGDQANGDQDANGIEYRTVVGTGYSASVPSDWLDETDQFLAGTELPDEHLELLEQGKVSALALKEPAELGYLIIMSFDYSTATVPMPQLDQATIDDYTENRLDGPDNPHVVFSQAATVSGAEAWEISYYGEMDGERWDFRSVWVTADPILYTIDFTASQESFSEFLPIYEECKETSTLIWE